MIEKLLTLISSIPKDKLLHAYISISIYLITSIVSKGDLFIPIITVTVISILKEVYDYVNRTKHTPDYMDVIASIVGVLPFFIFDLLKHI